MTRPVQARRFKFLGERFLVLIFGSIVIGVIGYIVAEWVPTTPKSIILGLASALVALGVVTFASEFILKSAFTEDVLGISELKHEVYNAGILQVAEESEITWLDLLGETRTVDVVGLRPSRLQANVWPHILRLAAARDLNVSIHFVDPDSVAAGNLAARLGETNEHYIDEIKRVAKNIEQEWKRAKTTVAWRGRRSTLQIEAIDAAPMHSIVKVDGKSCLIVEPALVSAGSQSTMVMVFRDMAGRSFPQRWLEEGLQDISNVTVAPLFSDRAPGGTP